MAKAGYQSIDPAEVERPVETWRRRVAKLVGVCVVVVGGVMAVSLASARKVRRREVSKETPLLALANHETSQFSWDVELTKTLYRQAVALLDAGECEAFSEMFADDGDVWSPTFRHAGTGPSAGKAFCEALARAQVQIDSPDLYQNANPDFSMAAVAARLQLGASEPPCIQATIVDLSLAFHHDYTIATLKSYYDLQELGYDFSSFGNCIDSTTTCDTKWNKKILHDLVQDSFTQYCNWKCEGEGSFAGYYTDDAILNDPYGELTIGRHDIGHDGCAILEGDFLALTTLVDGDVIVSCDDQSPLAATSSRYWWQWSGYCNGDDNGDFCVNAFVETGGTLINEKYKIPYQEFVMNATYQNSKFHECQVGHNL